MKIVIASLSEIKIAACKEAFGEAGNVFVAVKTESLVPEQPLGDETILGAHNRIIHAMRLASAADIYLAIENGLFYDHGKYFDRAVVAKGFNKPGLPVTYEFSKAVEVPTIAVDEAQRIGFENTTVGKVLKDSGFTQQHDDPHLTLTGISRKDYIIEALHRLKAFREPTPEEMISPAGPAYA